MSDIFFEFGGVPGHFFDYYGAEKPEEAALPISYWSRQRILLYCRYAKAPRKSMVVLERMNLGDLRANALRPLGKIKTGKRATFSDRHGQWRNTEFWGLDMANIRLLAGGCA